MKIALCFCGQPKFYYKSYQYIKNNLLDTNKQHHIDTYLHFWYDEIDKNGFTNISNTVLEEGNDKLQENVIEDLIKLYRPINLKYEKYKEFEIPKVEENRKSKTSPYATLSQYYSFKESFNLIKEDYDVIIKIRYDSMISTPIFIDNYDLNKINCLDDVNENTALNDGFFFSNHNNMKKISELFFNINKIYEENTFRWVNEYFLYKFVIQNEIEYSKNDIKVKWIRN